LLSKFASNRPVVSVKKHPERYLELWGIPSVESPQSDIDQLTLSPIGDISFLLIFSLSVATNIPMESSSLITNTNGSEILQNLILGLGIFPSLSGIV
jgi:hypothetical protein